jgi:hypothetical protein
MLRVVCGAAVVAILTIPAATGGIAVAQPKVGAQKAAPAVAARETPAAQLKRLESDVADLATQNSVLIDRVRELEAEIASLRASGGGRPPGPAPAGPQPQPGPSVGPAPPGPTANDKPVSPPVAPSSPEPKPVALNLDAAIRAACAFRVPADSGAPGARDLIVVSAQRRAAIDASLSAGGAAAVDIEALNVDACFSALGTDHVLVAPPGRRDAVVSVIGGDGTPLSQWLMQYAAEGKRARLAPSTDCTLLLDQIAARAGSGSAVWVELDMGASRCERDSDGSATVNRTKMDGYSGVIVLKVQKG